MKNNYSLRPIGHYQSFQLIAGLVLAVLLMSCASGLSVRSDTDPTADFSAYSSYDFFDPMGIEGGYNSPIFGEHFRAALGREMNQRGYRVSGDPDLLINVTIRGDDKVSMKMYTSPYMSGYYYNRPGGPYGGSGLGVGVAVGSGATVTTEASVFIDFVDREQRRIVWQGVAVVDVNDKVAQQLRDAIYTSVNRVLAQYPHTAGN